MTAMQNHMSIEKLNENQYDLIIFGAGLMGGIIQELCESNGISVACFLDNNVNKCENEKNGVPIHSLSYIQKEYQNPLFILSPIGIAPQTSMRQQLDSEGLTEIYTVQQFVENVSITNMTDVLKKIQLHKLKMADHKKKDSDILYIETLNFCITERCSLKCKDCCHLMQYYENPIDYKKEDLFSYLDRIDEVMDSVSELPILGGEPFVNKDVYDIVVYAQEKKSIQHILILTNATILPKKEELLRFDKNKVGFSISSYGELSIKTKEFCSLLDEMGLSYKCDYADTWSNGADIAYQNYSADTLKKVFHGCFAKFCTAFAYGIVYMCPFLAHASNLKAVPRDVVKGVDLMDKTTSLDILKRNINQYLYGSESLAICQYCSGKSMGAEMKEIPPAIQTKTTLLYTKYE